MNLWIISILIGGFPIAVLLMIAAISRKRKQARFKTPFTSKLLRPPGESLREEIMSLTERLNDQVLVFVLCCAWMTVATYPLMKQSLVGPILALLGVLVATGYVICGFYGIRIRRTLGRLQDYNLGFLGERAVGEELNQMLAYNYQVFHDIQFEGNPGSKSFNIDHVAVGPGGIFAIETKTRRKQMRGGYNSPRNIVEFNGHWLKYPWGNEDYGVVQARQNAIHLSKWLQNAVEWDIKVVPVLALPGWFVDRKGYSDVMAVSGREICSVFPKPGSKPILTPEQVKRIAYLLEQRCRTVDVG